MLILTYMTTVVMGRNVLSLKRNMNRHWDSEERIETIED